VLVSLTTARGRTYPGLTLALLAFAQLVIAIDFNIVYVALPDIRGALGFSDHSLQWVVSAYTVTFGGFLLLGGRAADRVGAHRVFMLAFALYGLSSLVGGLAQDQGVLIGARAAQGLGGALATPATLRLINTGFAEGPERTRALAVWGAAGSAGLSTGSLLGGVLTSQLGWAWVFYVNIPLAAAAVLAAPRLLPPDTAANRAPRAGAPRAGAPAAERPGFDLLGGLTVTAGITLIVFGLASGPGDGWTSPGGVGALAAGAVLLAAFAGIEARARDPLMPPRLLARPGLGAALGVMFLFQGVLGAIYYVFTSHVQDVRGYSAMTAGLAFLPLTLAAMVASAQLTTRLVARWGVRTTLASALLVTAAGLAALSAAMTTRTSYWALLPGLLLYGVGGGVTFVVQFVAATAGIAPAEQGVAAGVANTARMVGQSVVLAVVVAVATAGLPAGASPSRLDAGLRTAGWLTVGLTVAAALLTLALRRPAAVPGPTSQRPASQAPASQAPVADGEPAAARPTSIGQRPGG
jgi:MFS family permease